MPQALTAQTRASIYMEPSALNLRDLELTACTPRAQIYPSVTGVGSALRPRPVCAHLRPTLSLVSCAAHSLRPVRAQLRPTGPYERTACAQFVPSSRPSSAQPSRNSPKSPVRAQFVPNLASESFCASFMGSSSPVLPSTGRYRFQASVWLFFFTPMLDLFCVLRKVQNELQKPEKKSITGDDINNRNWDIPESAGLPPDRL